MSSAISYAKSNRGTIFQIVFLALLASVLFLPVDVFAADLAASGKATIKDTFGKNSTVLYTLYVLEILSGFFLYIKTKNLAVFGGIVAVLIFTNIGFGLFS